MFSEADAFLDAIWAAPDDTPRLAYADWMEEHGHADYARFIRLSCQIARGVFPPDERARLRRERYLLDRAIVSANPRAFANNTAGLSRYDYGIPSRSHGTDAESFLQDWPHWWPFVRPRLLSLKGVNGREADVARCDYLSQVEVLRVTGQADGPYFYEERDEVIWQPVAGIFLCELAANPAVGRLAALRVEPVEVTVADLEIFAASALAGRLLELHLWVQFADGSREDLRAHGGLVQHGIAQFLAAHGDRLLRDRPTP